jgi:hypothetical protein
MLDIFNIPGQQDNINIFYARGTTDWQTWTKPRNCKFIWMMCIGGGSGGGNGGTPTAGALGGGSGAITRALFPANVLPDTLFIQPGPGGAGGSAGNRSFVSIVASSAAAMNVVCASGTSAAAVGSGESAATTTVAGLLSLGSFTSIAGFYVSVTTYTPFTNSTMVCSGQNGGTAGLSAGSSIASVDFGNGIVTPTLNGGSLNAGGNGDNGVFLLKPFYSLGGAGGGSNNAGTGGRGGDGGYGSGGGGGGGGSVAGGTGGRGGGGLVIIATF